jgi:hypothetical protein
MANTRDYRAVTPIDVTVDGKVTGTRWREIGSAWDRPNGAIMLVLDAAPVRRPYVYLFRVEPGDAERETR